MVQKSAVREARRPESRGRPFRLAVPRDAVLVAMLNVAAVGVYLLLVRERVGPFIDNDEYIYGNLAQSVAEGDGSLWRGVGVGIRTLYPYVIAPAWMVADGESGYRLTQAIGVLLMSSMVWPAWLAARELVAGRWALLAPVLTVAGVWMAESARVMTEALAVPAVTWALCLTIVALRRDSRGWLVAAAGFAVLAAAARAQAGAALVVIALAFTLDVVRRPRGERAAAARATWRELGVLWIIVLGGTIAAAGPGRSSLGNYGGVVGDTAPLGPMVRFALDHATDVAFVAGGLAWLAVLALACSRVAWRSDTTGPFLSVFVAAVMVFLIVAGWFGATVSQRAIERYVEYLGPVTLVGLVPAVRLARWRAAAVVSVVAAGVALALQDVSAVGNAATSLHGIGQELLGWPGVPAAGSAHSVAGFLAGVGAVLTFGLWLRDRPGDVEIRGRGASFAVVAPMALLVLATAALLIPARWDWGEEHWVSANIRDTFGRVPDGLDRSVEKRATIVADTLPPTVPLWIEFFNKKIDAVVADAPESADVGAGYGPTCRLQFTDDGRFTSPACARGPQSYIFMTSGGEVPTLRGGEKAKRVLPSVYLTQGQPRLLALREPLCDEDTGACRQAPITTFTPKGGVLTLRFVGGQEPHAAQLGDRSVTIPAGRESSFAIPVPPGRAATVVQGDWPALLFGVPEVESTTLTEAGDPPVRLN